MTNFKKNVLMMNGEKDSQNLKIISKSNLLNTNELTKVLERYID